MGVRFSHAGPLTQTREWVAISILFMFTFLQKEFKMTYKTDVEKKDNKWFAKVTYGSVGSIFFGPYPWRWLALFVAWLESYEPKTK